MTLTIFVCLMAILYISFIVCFFISIFLYDYTFLDFKSSVCYRPLKGMYRFPGNTQVTPTAHGDKYRGPEPPTFHRDRDLGTLSPKRNVSIKSLHLEFKKPCRIGERNSVRSLIHSSKLSVTPKI